MILRRGQVPVPVPPMVRDEVRRVELAAWLLFAFAEPTDRALTGWRPAGEADFEAEALTRITPMGGAA